MYKRCGTVPLRVNNLGLSDSLSFVGFALCYEKFLLNLVDSLDDLYMPEKSPSRKRGMREVGIVIAAAALVMIPSYIGRIELNRLKIPISIVAASCFALFLVGAFLLTKGTKD